MVLDEASPDLVGHFRVLFIAGVGVCFLGGVKSLFGWFSELWGALVVRREGGVPVGVVPGELGWGVVGARRVIGAVGVVGVRFRVVGHGVRWLGVWCDVVGWWT
jgi:hypothetical protein